jgi:hypothetical protein
MTATIDVTQDAVIGSLCRFLEDVMPGPFEAVMGQANRVPEPTSSSYAVVTPLSRARLSTNRTGYGGDPTAGYRSVVQPTDLAVQVDLYGEDAADNAGRLVALFADLAGVDWFSRDGKPVAPLYAEDARQVQFLDEASQYLDRRTVTVHLQVNQTVTAPQQFAAEVRVNLRGAA